MTTRLWRLAQLAAGGSDYCYGTRRTCRPGETLGRIQPLLPLAGITRLAEVTGLDRIGLPVFQAVRPNSRNLSVSQGKGLTRAQARVSALMESLESFHAEELHEPVVRESVGSMRRQLDYDPYQLSVVRRTTAAVFSDPDFDPYGPPVGTPCLLNDDSVIDWVAATGLATGHRTWVPRQLCELNFCIDERVCLPYFRATSNGLASGNTFAEALVHGLCEVVERDSSWRRSAAHRDPEQWVCPSTIGSRLAQRLLQRFDRAGMRTRIIDVSGPTGLPSFDVLLEESDSANSYLGAGCHPDRVTALLRALTESAQSRLAHISGSRDDFFRRGYLGLRWTGEQSREDRDQRPLGDFESSAKLPRQGWWGTLKHIVERIVKTTGMPPLVVDLTRPEFRIPVVFVVAPGLGISPPRRR